MDLKIYKDKEDALNDIPRLENDVLPCLEMVMDDVFTLPLYYPVGFASDRQEPLGKINVKFSFSNMRPMISVGNWVMYYFINAEILDFKLIDEYQSSQKDIIKLFKMAIPVNDDKTLKFSNYTPFVRPFLEEIEFFTKICNIKGSLVLDKIIWDF